MMVCVDNTHQFRFIKKQKCRLYSIVSIYATDSSYYFAAVVFYLCLICITLVEIYSLCIFSYRWQAKHTIFTLLLHSLHTQHTIQQKSECIKTIKCHTMIRFVMNIALDKSILSLLFNYGMTKGNSHITQAIHSNIYCLFCFPKYFDFLPIQITRNYKLNRLFHWVFLIGSQVSYRRLPNTFHNLFYISSIPKSMAFMLIERNKKTTRSFSNYRAKKMN